MARNTYESGWLGNKQPKTERGAADKQYVSLTPKDAPSVGNSASGKDPGWDKVETRRSWPGNATGKVRRGQEVLYGSLHRSGRKIGVR